MEPPPGGDSKGPTKTNGILPLGAFWVKLVRSTHLLGESIEERRPLKWLIMVRGGMLVDTPYELEMRSAIVGSRTTRVAGLENTAGLVGSVLCE